MNICIFRCPNLEVLNLSWCWEVSDDGLAFIVDSCHKLKELHLRGLHELYGTPFRRIMSNLPNLVFLDLSQCNKIQDDLIERVSDQNSNLIIWNYYGETVVKVRHHSYKTWKYPIIQKFASVLCFWVNNLFFLKINWNFLEFRFKFSVAAL